MDIDIIGKCPEMSIRQIWKRTRDENSHGMSNGLHRFFKDDISTDEGVLIDKEDWDHPVDLVCGR